MELSLLCKKLGLILIIGGDPVLAQSVRADGIHLSEANFQSLKKWKLLRNNWIITAASHSLKKNFQIKNAKLDAAIYSPIFKTKTHTGSKPIGHRRLHMDAQKTRNLKIYAMGGIVKESAKLLNRELVTGVAGIRILDYDKI